MKTLFRPQKALQVNNRGAQENIKNLWRILQVKALPIHLKNRNILDLKNGPSHSSTASLSNGMRSISMRERALRTAADRSRQIQEHPLTRQLTGASEESGEEGG